MIIKLNRPIHVFLQQPFFSSLHFLPLRMHVVIVIIVMSASLALTVLLEAYDIEIVVFKAL